MLVYDINIELEYYWYILANETTDRNFVSGVLYYVYFILYDIIILFNNTLTKKYSIVSYDIIQSCIISWNNMTSYMYDSIKKDMKLYSDMILYHIMWDHIMLYYTDHVIWYDIVSDSYNMILYDIVSSGTILYYDIV